MTLQISKKIMISFPPQLKNARRNFTIRLSASISVISKPILHLCCIIQRYPSVLLFLVRFQQPPFGSAFVRRPAGEQHGAWGSKRTPNVLAESILFAMERNINKLHNKIQKGRIGTHLFPVKSA